jgi:hypothetical protein
MAGFYEVFGVASSFGGAWGFREARRDDTETTENTERTESLARAAALFAVVFTGGEFI